MLTHMFEKSKHIFQKFVRFLDEIVLTIENAFDIIQTYRTNVSIIRSMNRTDKGRTNMSSYYNNRREYCRVYAMTPSGRSRRQRMIIAGLLFTIVLITMIVSIRHLAFADEPSSDNLTKHYSSIIIHCGDTVDSISEKCACASIVPVEKYKSEIMSCNHIYEDTKLIPGNYIVVPEYVYSITP